jgi:hypothetical protein
MKQSVRLLEKPLAAWRKPSVAEIEAEFWRFVCLAHLLVFLADLLV